MHRNMHQGRIIRFVPLISVLMLATAWCWAPQVAADDIDRLLRQATSGSHLVRLQALEALGQSGDVQALQPLLAALQDDNDTIRERAEAALRSLAHSLQGVYRVVAQWIKALLLTLNNEASSPPPPLEKTHVLRRL